MSLFQFTAMLACHLLEGSKAFYLSPQSGFRTCRNIATTDCVLHPARNGDILHGADLICDDAASNQVTEILLSSTLPSRASKAVKFPLCRL